MGRVDPQGDWSLRVPIRRCQAYLRKPLFYERATLNEQREYIGDFVKHIREAAGSSRPKAFCVGEFWKGTSQFLQWRG
jgi:hypothetical protein